MSKNTATISLSFIAKVAIICNAFYLFTWLVMTVQSLKIPNVIANFCAVLGLEMAPGVNIAFILAWLWVKFTKRENYVENWKTILIFLLFSIQLGSIFI